MIHFLGGVSYSKSDDSHWLQYVSKFRCHQIRKSDKMKTDYHYWEPIGGLSSSSKDLECYFQCTHFLLYCLPPKVIPIFLVQSQGFLHSFGHLGPKFVCHLLVSLVDCCNDSLSFLRHGLSTRRMQAHHLYPLPLHILQPQ